MLCHLADGRLADINDCTTAKVIRRDLRTHRARSFRWALRSLLVQREAEHAAEMHMAWVATAVDPSYSLRHLVKSLHLVDARSVQDLRSM